MTCRRSATLQLAAYALLAALAGPAAIAQTRVFAGNNDVPHQLINANFNSPTMTYNAELPTGGSTTGLTTSLAFNQVRLFKSTSGCSMIAATNNFTNNVTIWFVDAAGVASPAIGAVFTAGAGVQSLAWAPDGGALYVPLAVAGTANVVTFTVSCTAGGGGPTVTNAGTVAITGFDLLRDAEVIGAGTGTHLCLTGTNTNNVGCVPILPSRLPGTAAVNTIAVSNVRGMRIAPNNCGFAGSGNTATVQGFTVSVGGTITATNTGTASTAPRYGAIAADGSLVAVGGFGTQFTLFTMNGSCQLTLVGSNNNGIPTSLVEYMAFDTNNLLYVSDSLANQIRVFAPTGGGIGAALSTTNTNHGTTNPPAGIDVALLSSLPVELLELAVD